MLPVRIILAVQDAGYVEPLLHYIHGSEYVNKVQITAFTRMETLLQYPDLPDLIVGEAHMLESWLSKERSTVPWVVLSEGGDLPSLHGDGLITAKYQPLPQLIDLWIGHVRGKRAERMSLFNGSAQIIGFMSALGGSGKTTASINMAKQLGMLGKKVFYLNLEIVNSLALFPHEQRGGHESVFSRLLYEIKSSQDRSERSEIALAPYVIRHDVLKCDVFEPSSHLKELMEMTEDDVEILIDLIANCGQYDVIVIDTDNHSQERLHAVMGKCSMLLWVLLDDLISMYKTGAWFAHMEKEDAVEFNRIMAKSRFIMNRFIGSLANPLPRKDIRIDSMLSYVPSWKQVNQEDLLLCSPIFQRDVLKLCSDSLDENDEIGTGMGGGRAYG
ncbi:AAA family ATPase [Paenibacillus dakarensis]|uniref:AAA family ATPase n=1 Tax=Paenibacillus dakarensis TaxID=1527293 RepID=UPI0006D5A3F8|nr:AAA family ATPase [Paenibacillus dakarensis]